MLSRRNVLAGAAALAASRFAAAGQVVAAPPRPRLTEDPFALGVASGEPARDGFVIWTRIAGLQQDAIVAWEVAADERFRRIVRTGRAAAPVARGGAVHVRVRGLAPGRRWFYRFHLAGAVSRIGRVSTIADRPDRLRLALTSCQHWEQGWFTGYRDMIAADVAAVLQMGDYIYEKSFGAGTDVRSFGAPDPVTLEDYRARHALYRSDRDLADAHAALPFIVAFDDHEVENDYAGVHGAITADSGAFMKRRAAAYQAYFEHMPLDPAALAADGGIQLYRRFRWGDLASVHVLDTRQHRSAHACATAEERGGRVLGNCAALDDPARTMLGHAQEAWLDDGFRREQARWTLIAQQTLFAPLALPQGPGARYSDIWDGYGAARGRLLDALARPSVENALMLGGDVHSFWLNDVARIPGGTPVATEIVTSCLASRNGPEALFAPAKALNPHVRLLDNHHAGYVLLDVTLSRTEIDLRAVESLADPDSATRSLARRTVAAGKAGVA
ncbi:alkaline phosphatase D family protein [Sphingomonas sanxanigenens]|uniref:Alkaline phosphatase n=1 Tax=Sphingomonas sanxanigenens DSM 19645 = NX02 TaxID=1123269 RepID=W0A5Y8_9SPHN|nr:alkaline phosphatase D family protein [Sphingomonas sanxanigenens]AHE53379.1 hypothetical protein NX02_08275 [Sphingomonas sanxanigenens DSM 19645 = NX02]